MFASQSQCIRAVKWLSPYFCLSEIALLKFNSTCWSSTKRTSSSSSLSNRTTTCSKWRHRCGRNRMVVGFTGRKHIITWLSEWVFWTPNGQNLMYMKLHSMTWCMSTSYKTNKLNWIVIALPRWNNNRLWVCKSPYSWFLDNQLVFDITV